MEKMLSLALSDIRGPLNQLLVNLEGEHGQTWLKQFKKFLRKEATWSQLKCILSCFQAPANTGFVASTVFNKGKKTGIKIKEINDFFRLKFRGKVEKPFPGSMIYFDDFEPNDLELCTTDEIFVMIGGEKRVETSLFEIFCLMEAHAANGVKHLLVNGHANIFFVRDFTGEFRTIFLEWEGEGWKIEAFEKNTTFFRGRVFYRNPRTCKD